MAFYDCVRTLNDMPWNSDDNYALAFMEIVHLSADRQFKYRLEGGGGGSFQQDSFSIINYFTACIII